MKIGFVVDDTLDKTDGIQQYVLTLGQWFSTQGHEVHYLVGETKRNEIPNIHSLSRNMHVRFNQNHLSVPVLSDRSRIAKLLNDEQFDVLHVQMPYSPLLAKQIIKLAPLKTAVTGTFHILPYSVVESVATRLLGMLLGRSLRRFDSIISVSEAAKTFAEKSFNVSSQVIPNTVDTAAFKNNINIPPTRKIKIVFLGRLVPRKGCLELIRAISLLPEPIKQKIQVEIGGKGALLPKIQKMIDEKNLSKIVKLSGFIAEKDKPQFLGQADIAVFPSISGESFGIVLLEAMASGARVVIGGDNPGYRCVLRDKPELLVNPADAAGFSECLRGFIEDAPARHQVDIWQQKHIQQYDITVVGKQIELLYKSTIAKRNNNLDN